MFIICSVLNFSGWIWWENKNLLKKYRFLTFIATALALENDITVCQRQIAQHPWALGMFHKYWFGAHCTYKRTIYGSIYCLIHDAIFIGVNFLNILYRVSYIYILLDNIRLPVYIHVRLGFEFLWTVLNQELYQHDFSKPYDVA